jgi:hypothetical protein
VDPYHIDTDPDADPDPAYHFDADSDPDFNLMRMWTRMRIQATKMMRIHADPDTNPDPQHCQKVPLVT